MSRTWSPSCEVVRRYQIFFTFYFNLKSVLTQHFLGCYPRSRLAEVLDSAVFGSDLESFSQQKNADLATGIQQKQKLSKQKAADVKRQTRDRITELKLQLTEAKEVAEDEIASVREAKKDAVKSAKRMLERTI